MRFPKVGRFLNFKGWAFGKGLEVRSGGGIVALAPLLNCASDNDGINVAISCCMDKPEDCAGCRVWGGGFADLRLH
jgi:hypothetical protein